MTGRASCTGETAHFPGTPGCEQLGEACPADGWPTQLPAGRSIVYVRAGATGGSGTRAQPFGALQQALSANGAGAIIALAPGSYEASTQALPPNTVLWGACTGQTMLTMSANNPSPATVLSNSAGVALRQLTVTGGGMGVAATGAAQVTLNDVVIDGVTGVGLRIERGARVTGSRVVVRGTRARSDGTLGLGVQVEGQLELSGAIVTNNDSVGVYASGADTIVTLTQTAVTANQDIGAWSRQGAALTFSNSVVEDNRDTGLNVVSVSTVRLTDVVIRRTAVAGPGTGQNVWVDGATVIARRLRLEDANALGLASQNAAVVELEDFVGQRDFGLGANAGARVTVTRAFMNETTGVAFSSRGSGSVMDVFDATVFDPRLGPGLLTAGGLLAVRGGRLSATRFHVHRAKGLAVSVQNSGSQLTLTDARIEDMGAGSDENGGSFIGVNEGASFTAERVLARGGMTVGLFVARPGTVATVTDFDLETVRPPESQGGLFGNGVIVGFGARLDGTRLRVSGVHDTGVLADGAGSRITLTDATVLGTALTCTAPECAQRVAVGLSSQNAAFASLTRFSLASNGGIGAQVADSAQLDLSEGWVGFHQIGVNVMNAAYDLSRLDQNVVYARNGQKLAAQVLPLPKLPPAPP